MLKAVTGVVRPYSGTVTWDGTDISRLPAHKILRLGIAHIPEGRAMLAPLTVEDNLLMGAYTTPRAEVGPLQNRMLELFPALRRRLRTTAGNLSGGEQQMLAIARGLMSRPRLIAIDEPSMGLAPAVANDVLAALTEVIGTGVSVLLVEQNAALAVRLADIVVVMAHGEVQAQGSAQDLGQDVLAAYVQ
jgi:branched-chain amino acid transport system ATP-binding protein